MRCWDASPKRRPEIDVIRRNVEKFYHGSDGEQEGYYAVQRQDGYYSAHDVAWLTTMTTTPLSLESLEFNV